MIHYHGGLITPSTAQVQAIHAGHAFVSFRAPSQLGLVMEIAQSFAVDNGAFSAWKSGSPITDWSPYYAWAASLMRHPGFDFAVIPDVIDGDEYQNDLLVDEWPLPRWIGAPVWHMHESVERLVRLCADWPRVCIGSSGEFAAVGNARWWERMGEAMDAICIDGMPLSRIHGLRMLNPAVFRHLPLSSADSTNIAYNIGLDIKWNGAYSPVTKEARASVMRHRIEHVNGGQRWAGIPTKFVQAGQQEELWA